MRFLKPISAKLSLVLSSFLLLFMLTAAIAYYGAKAYEASLVTVVDEAMPKFRQAAQFTLLVKDLPFLTEQLSRSETQAMRRLAMQEIEHYSAQIISALNHHPHDQLHLKFATIQNELAHLDELVNQQLLFEREIQQRILDLYRLFDQFESSLVRHAFPSEWSIAFSALLVRSAKLVGLDRLNDVRQEARVIEQSLLQQASMLALMDESLQSQALQYHQELGLILFGSDGLVQMRSEQLRLQGRATGRSRFIRSMVQDFGFEVEHQGWMIQNQLTAEVSALKNTLSQQIYWIGVLSISVLLFLIIMIWLIKIQVINRLVSLKKQVLDQVENPSKQITVAGHDEITDLSKAFNYFAEKVTEHNLRVEALSRTDALTGVHNRRGFDYYLERIIQQSGERKSPMALLMIDVDFFKNYNDLYGHQAGDQALRDVARLLRKVFMRGQDFVARYGGEEFACILPDTDNASAITLSGQLLEAMQNLQLEHQGSSVSTFLTLSIGVACVDEVTEINPKALIELADKALYEAKFKGRNRMVVKRCGLNEE